MLAVPYLRFSDSILQKEELAYTQKAIEGQLSCHSFIVEQKTVLAKEDKIHKLTLLNEEKFGPSLLGKDNETFLHLKVYQKHKLADHFTSNEIINMIKIENAVKNIKNIKDENIQAVKSVTNEQNHIMLAYNLDDERATL